MSYEPMTQEQAINQLVTVVLALAHSQAAVNHDHTLARLGGAVIACRNSGFGDGYALQIFEQVFPGKALPIVLSDEEFAKKQRELGQ
ncbi:hypothetical protein [Pseudomonas shirazensis]|uniref:hypothetical protein n=1 Tax=Pseudomonas shirazensis TaxID=2745494 RepID=UPI001644D6EE|nr:hypothetical protein [Pseudomonas shirazensis]MBV4500362.1 hypothetical protein [Pseudomonas shirazensis]